MKDFKTFLSEAQVSKKNLTKMVTLFSKYMGKKLGKGYYVLPYMVEIKGGMGQEVYLQDFRKIRFNWIQGHIKSITLWDDKKDVFKKGKGSRTIQLNGLNVIQMAYRIVEIMKKPSYTGTEVRYPQPMYESELPEYVKEKMISEQKRSRVKPEEFAIMLKDAGIQDLKNVSWGQFEEVAAKNSAQIPGKIRSAPSRGKGVAKTWDVTSFLSSETMASNTITGKVSSSDMNSTENPIDGIEFEVERMDKLTIDIPDISDLESKYADAIAKYDVETMSDESYVKFVYGDLENKVNALAQGLNRLLVLVGGPGLGKTFTTGQILKSYGWKKSTGLYTPGSANELYRVLYMNRNPGDIIVIDDADKVMDDPNAVNIMKQAFTSGDEHFVGAPGSQGIRNISKLTDQEKEDFMTKTDEQISSGEKYELPHLFDYKGSLVFISNRSKSQFNDAILSRSQFVNMEFTPKQVFMKIEEVLPHMPNDDGKKPDLTDAEKYEVFELAQLIYWKELKKAMIDWEEAMSGKEKKKLIDPRELRPTLRFIAKGLLYREIAKKTGAGDSWVPDLKASL